MLDCTSPRDRKTAKAGVDIKLLPYVYENPAVAGSRDARSSCKYKLHTYPVIGNFGRAFRGQAKCKERQRWDCKWNGRRFMDTLGRLVGEPIMLLALHVWHVNILATGENESTLPIYYTMLDERYR
jgi:hypothetical protein